MGKFVEEIKKNKKPKYNNNFKIFCLCKRVK